MAWHDGIKLKESSKGKRIRVPGSISTVINRKGEKQDILLGRSKVILADAAAKSPLTSIRKYNLYSYFEVTPEQKAKLLSMAVKEVIAYEREIARAPKASSAKKESK